MRRQVMERVSDYALMLLSCITDESSDPVFFPKQEWDAPFSRTARYEPDEMELRRQAHYKRTRKGKR